MWTEDQLVEQLRALGLTEGASVVAHVFPRAVGPIEGGEATLLAAIRRVLGADGNLLVPTFTPQFMDPAESEDPPDSPAELERQRDSIPVFDRAATAADRVSVGTFPELVRQQPDAFRSEHPVLSFAAVGPLAEWLTEGAPLHYPLGTDSPLARIHDRNGWALLIGAGQEANAVLHLAEIWADVPYIHRPARVKAGEDHWVNMQGSPGCRDGFYRIEPVLRQARILRRGEVGNAPAQLMRLQATVSMAVMTLQGAGDSLLCDDPNCPRCRVARKYAGDSTYVEGQSL